MKDFNQAFTALDQRASATITVLDYTLLSGKTITVNGNVLTEGVGFNAVTSNNQTATNIASAIDALALVNAAAVGPLVTIHADAPGTAANSYNLLTNADAEALTLSGSTLAGGVAATYTADLPLDGDEGLSGVEATILITGFTGASGSLVVTPQYSYDKETWFDDNSSVFTAVNGTTSLPYNETKRMNFTGQYVRFKLVTSGVISSITGQIFARAVEGGDGFVGGVTAMPIQAASGTVSGVSSSASTGVLLAANTARKGYKIFNASTQILYVKEGGAASIASGGYSYQIAAGGFYETPSSPIPTVAIHGIWASANGFANITELT